MGILNERDAVVIGRVRLRGHQEGRSLDEHRLAGVLRNASIQTRRVPPGGLLCVRALHDPAPRTQPLHSRCLYPLPAWEQAINRRLDSKAENAARPAEGHVPAGADSVLFLDEAEVLACLAMDWLNGSLGSNWWWQQVLKTFDYGAVFKKWMEAPNAVPAALEMLHTWRVAERFVAQMPESSAASLLDAVLKTHGVRSVDVVLDGAETAAREDDAQAVASTVHLQQKHGFVPPPWERMVSLREEPRLTMTQQRLLVQALLLRRAPALARSAKFQQELSGYWMRVQAIPAWRRQAEAGTREKRGQQSSHTGDAASLEDETAVERVQAEQAASSKSTDQDAAKRDALIISKDEVSALPLHTAKIAEDAEQAPGNLIAVIDPLAETARGAAIAAADDERIADQAVAGEWLRVHTHFGGVLFLLNAAISLGFYPDFTEPHGEQIDLDLWDLLAILGERFTLGDLREDALWPLLAELARGDEKRDPRERHRRLQIDDDRIEGIANRVEVFLRESLHRDDAARLLCCRPGTVTVTATHLDAYFSMETHPIEIRLACLDRDPGWIPAGGRYVAFHFD